jgi:signal transduction histidine kinase/ligand-binding sensor domain-containing protein
MRLIRPFSGLLALAAFGLWCIASGQSASAQYRFDTWTTDDGLPQNCINDILQTSDGYLWMTTFDGLVRYDGVRFRVFNSGNTPGIRSSRFLTLFEDSDRNLWITTDEVGVTLYRNGDFITYTTADGLPHRRVGVREDSKGIVIKTELGLLRWKNGKFFPYDSNDGLPYAPGDGYWTPGFWSRSGVAWNVDQSTLRRIENGRTTASIPCKWSSADELRMISETPSGTVWIVTRETTNETWRLRNGEFTLMTGEGKLPRKWIKTILEDRNGNTWFGTVDAGLYLLKGDRFTAFTITDGLSSDHTTVVYQDREANIWVGSENGLNRLNERTITAFSRQHGLAADNTYPIYQDRSGTVWIGSWTGLTRYSNGEFSNVTQKFGLENENVTAIFEDRSGALWVGTWGPNIYRIRDDSVTRYSKLLDLPYNPTHAILEDQEGALWFGTQQGLIKYQDGRFRRYTKADGLSGEIVFDLFLDRSGALWIGSESGIAVYRNGEFHAYGASDGVPQYMVRCTYEDDAGTIWVGTYDAGLYRFRDGRFTSCTVRSGLFNNGVFQILEDSQGFFWISCNLGIYRVSRRELDDFAEGRRRKVTSIPYGKREGMLNQECNGGNQPAGIKAADGSLWFPTARGVAVIDPSKISVNFQPPAVLIDEVAIDNKIAHAADELRIGPAQTNFALTYTGLSFIDPERMEFRYRLVGLDSDWIEAGTRRTAYYSHVSPGTYTFEVIAANRDGVWSPQPALIRVVVVPPFWRTWWFTLIAISLLVGLVVVLYRRRISALKRAHALQETFSRQLLDSQERERQRIAAALHDSLGQSLLIIKNRAFLASSADGDREIAQEQLDEITASASQAIEEVREIAYNLRPYQLDRFGLTRTLQAIFTRFADSSSIRFSAEIDQIDGLFSTEEEISIYRIIQESINNIVKHSNATEATLLIKRGVREVSLCVHDNGRGFDHTAATGTPNGRGGFGLVGMGERVRMLGGTHVVDSALGQGTTITIKLTTRLTTGDGPG